MYTMTFKQYMSKKSKNKKPKKKIKEFPKYKGDMPVAEKYS
jgi:hypothetical protein